MTEVSPIDRTAVLPRDTARLLRRRPDEDALVQIGLGLNRGLFSGDVGEAAFWLLVFVCWRDIEPSERVRALLEALLVET